MKFRLRPFTPVSSTENIERILSDAIVARPFGVPYGENVQKFKLKVEEYVKDCNYLFEITADGNVIGFVGFCPSYMGDLNALKEKKIFSCDDATTDSLLDTFLDVSYALDKDYIGMGIGPKAVNAAINQVFQTNCAGVTAIYAIFSDTGENRRSARVLEKNGFKPLSTREKVELASGDCPDIKVCYLINPIVQEKYGEPNFVETQKQ